jgi:hypothetical protein
MEGQFGSSLQVQNVSGNKNYNDFGMLCCLGHEALHIHHVVFFTEVTFIGASIVICVA